MCSCVNWRRNINLKPFSALNSEHSDLRICGLNTVICCWGLCHYPTSLDCTWCHPGKGCWKLVSLCLQFISRNGEWLVSHLLREPSIGNIYLDWVGHHTDPWVKGTDLKSNTMAQHLVVSCLLKAEVSTWEAILWESMIFSPDPNRVHILCHSVRGEIKCVATSGPINSVCCLRSID